MKEQILTGQVSMMTVPVSGKKSSEYVSSKQTNIVATDITSTGDIAFWGKNNTHPQDVNKDLEASPWISTVLDWKARAGYGGGMMIGYIDDYRDDGSEIFKQFKPTDPKIKPVMDFIKKSNFNRSYLFPAFRDLYKFYNVFPELIKSNDGKSIVDINVHDASFCRWKKKNSLGELTNCIINGDWGANRNPDNDINVDVVNPFYDPVSAIGEINADKFMYPISYPTNGSLYYSLPDWNGMRTSGLLKWANRIIAYKEAIMNNQITVKYMIETTMEFWEWKYPGYANMKAEEKQKVHLDELTKMDKMLQGETNAGKSIMTISPVDKITKQSTPGIKITPIADFIKDGKYIEDSQEASSMQLYSLAVDGTLIGNTPGKGMGAGSGSDKRVAFNNYIALCDIHVDLILEPINTIRDFNGWDDSIQFRMRRPYVNTLDKGKEVTQKTI